MSEFERETRYVVLKLNKLTSEEIDQLKQAIKSCGWDKALTECVVVESDWQIYNQTWDAVQHMSEGRPQIQEEIKQLEEQYYPDHGPLRPKQSFEGIEVITIDDEIERLKGE